MGWERRSWGAGLGKTKLCLPAAFPPPRRPRSAGKGARPVSCLAAAQAAAPAAERAASQGRAAGRRPAQPLRRAADGGKALLRCPRRGCPGSARGGGREGARGGGGGGPRRRRRGRAGKGQPRDLRLAGSLRRRLPRKNRGAPGARTPSKREPDKCGGGPELKRGGRGRMSTAGQRLDQPAHCRRPLFLCCLLGGALSGAGGWGNVCVWGQPAAAVAEDPALLPLCLVSGTGRAGLPLASVLPCMGSTSPAPWQDPKACRESWCC